MQRLQNHNNHFSSWPFLEEQSTLKGCDFFCGMKEVYNRDREVF